MDRVTIQKIVVLTTLSDRDKSLIFSGVKIASFFNKELCLVYHSKKKKNKTHEYSKQKIENYLVAIREKIPELKTSFAFINGPVSELSVILADNYETILIIADASGFKKYSKTIIHSPVPFLFINPYSNVSSFKKIVLPVDLRKGNSDSALWSSYFGRFNKAEILILAASQKGRREQKQVARNIILIKKLLQKFNIQHKIYKGRRSSLYNSFEGLELAIALNYDMLVILGSSTITPLDWIVGLSEKKIVNKAGDLPVLLVNSKRDNYVLCS